MTRPLNSDPGSMSATCRVCRGPLVTLLDFGPRPLTNRFPATEDEVVPTHPLTLTLCSACSLLQLADPCPPQLLKPLRPMLYNEPEGHLDELVDEVIQLPGISTSSRVCGLTYKEATTLERLRRRGFSHLTTLSAADDLGIDDPCAGLETIQGCFTPKRFTELAARHGPCDVVIVRHLLEHAHDPRQFAAAVMEIAAPGGHVVFEVPDCTTALREGDYSGLWEEHVSYFTPATLVGTLGHCGLQVARLLVYPYSLENSLVAIAEKRAGLVSAPTSAAGSEKRPDSFSGRFDETRRRWHATLSEWRRVGPVALLGAGHLAVTFINLLGLEPLIDYVCDDAPEKVNRYIPGTQLRISPSSVILQHSFSVCLMAVAPESEPKVLARNQEFIDRGGRFASIFAASDHALKLAAASEPESDES